MDPISQGVLGSVAALSLAPKAHARLAAVAGWVAGMLADADVLIRSSSDPLLNIEYHRHFTHALAFIPLGGLVAAAVLWLFTRRHLSFSRLYLYCVAGYATAGLLDACTSYGTQLYWPFSNFRVAWNIISVVDPLFTLPLLLLVGAGIYRRSPGFARYAAVYAALYLGFGIVQRERASSLQVELAAQRGHHSIEQPTVKPSIANLVLWRSVYLHQGRYYVDALRVGLFTEPETYPGESLPAFDLRETLAGLPEDSVRARDLKRFHHFSEGYLAALPDEPTFITDLRYSPLPNSIDPLWGIDISDTNPEASARFETRRAISEADRAQLLAMLRGTALVPSAP